MDARSDPSKRKFHGKLDTPAYYFTEYDKEEFIQDIKGKVSYCGLEMFFTMPDADGMMINHILNSHLFKFDDIIKEYESRLIKPNPVLKEDSGEKKGQFRPDFVHTVWMKILNNKWHIL